MIKMKGTWIGLDKLGAEELEKLRAPQAKSVIKATLYFEGRIKEKLTGPRHGRMYFVHRNRKRQGRNSRGQYTQKGFTHQASAPGEPPASWSGDYRKSITHGIAVEGDEVSGEVGTSVEYARILEYGGVTGRGHLVRILPRPLWEITWIEEQTNLEAILNESVKT